MGKIQGFAMKNGKITEETLAKLKAAGDELGEKVIDLEAMFGKGYKAEELKKGE